MMKSVFILCALLLCLVHGGLTDAPRKLIENLQYQRYKNPFAIMRNAINASSRWFPLGCNCNKKEVNGSNESHNNTDKPPRPPNQVEPIEIERNVLTIKVAAIFRDNLIRVFGYVLHRPQMELTSELYTSLYFILNTIKLNQVNIISMVPILKNLSFASSNDRFLKIFEAMETHLPDYLKCAATFWKTAIDKKEVNMDNILKPNADGPLKVDVLEGLNAEIFEDLSDRIDASDADAKNEQEKKVSYNFNLNIVQIMKHIQKNKKDMNQIFFGALILFFPRGLLQPDLEESIRLLTEFLQQTTITEWQKNVNELDDATIEDPYYVVNTTLHKLILNRNITVVIKESAQILINNLANRNPTAINPHYNSIASFVNLTDIKIEYMLNYIAKGAYPIEIVLSGCRIKYHLEQAHIRYLTLMVHFNPYLYSTPTEILTALLNKVIKGQPDLPSQIIDAVGAVYSYLTFTFRYIVFPATLPDDILNLNTLFLGIRAPDIERRIVKNVVTIISLLQEDNVAYQKLLLEIPVYKCATPVMCFLELLQLLHTKNIISSETILVIEVIVKSSCCIGVCPIQEPQDDDCKICPPPSDLFRIFNGTQSKELNEDHTSTQTTSTPTVLTTLPPPSEGPPKTATTAKSTVPTHPTTPEGPTHIPSGLTAPANTSVLVNLVYNMSATVATSQDGRLINIIINVLNSTEYKDKVVKDSPELVISCLWLILEELKTKESEIEPKVRELLDDFLIKVKHIEDVLMMISKEKEPQQPELGMLIIAVPAPKEDERSKFQQLTQLLQKQELFSLIQIHLKNESYKNIGSLLKAVLTEELKLKEKLNHQEREAAKYYVDKIQLYGFGQGKIVWGVSVDVLSREINIAQIMDNAIGFAALQAEQKHQFNDITRYLKTHPSILQSWDKWIYYTKCGDFSKALFHLLLKQGSLPSKIRKAVNDMTPLISYDENGQKPAFGIKQ